MTSDLYGVVDRLKPMTTEERRARVRGLKLSDVAELEVWRQLAEYDANPVRSSEHANETIDRIFADEFAPVSEELKGLSTEELLDRALDSW